MKPAMRPSTPVFDYHNEDWMLSGACVDMNPELWFTPPENPAVKQAVAICQTCPVRVRCLDYALATDSAWGVWGGLTEKQRRKIKENSDAA